MRYENENIWLTQKMMATLYDVDVRTVNEHIQKILSDLELQEAATILKFRIVQTEGERKVSRVVQDHLYQSDFDKFMALEAEADKISEKT